MARAYAGPMLLVAKGFSTLKRWIHAISARACVCIRVASSPLSLTPFHRKSINIDDDEMMITAIRCAVPLVKGANKCLPYAISLRWMAFTFCFFIIIYIMPKKSWLHVQLPRPTNRDQFEKLHLDRRPFYFSRIWYLFKCVSSEHTTLTMIWRFGNAHRYRPSINRWGHAFTKRDECEWPGSGNYFTHNEKMRWMAGDIFAFVLMHSQMSERDR